MKYHPLFFCIAFAVCPTAFAELNDDDLFSMELEQLIEIEIATGTKTTLKEAPSIVSVVTAYQIEKMGANNLYQVLETINGVHVYLSNLNRMRTSISIRGIHTAFNPHVLILVDGFNTTYTFNGSPWSLFNLGVELIDRIEIIKGPGSAVYGADAYSGVINIITKTQSDAEQNDTGIQAGSFGYKTAWLNQFGQLGEIDYALSAQWESTDGDNSRVIEQDAMHTFGLDSLSNAPRALDTRRKMLDMHLNLSYQNWSMKTWYLDREAGTGPGIGQALSDSDIDEEESFSLQTQYILTDSTHWQSTVELSYLFHDQYSYFKIYPDGFPVPIAFDVNGTPTAFTVFTDGLIGAPATESHRYHAHWNNLFTGFEHHQIRVEAGYTKDDLKTFEAKNFGTGVLTGDEDFVDGRLTQVRNTPFIFSQDQDRELYYLSVQDEWKINDKVQATIGMRYDDYSDFGSTFNPRVALVWANTDKLTTKFIYGQAYRAPSMADLHLANNPVSLGNLNLEPEEITTYEVALDYQASSRLTLSANIYSYDAEKMIDFVPQLDGSSIAQNIGSISGQGLETQAKWQVNRDLQISASLALQEAEDDNGHDIADAPQTMFDISVNWQVNPQTHVYFDSRFIRDRDRLVNDPRQSIDDYNWSNLSVQYQIDSHWMGQVTVRNLFDESADEPSDGQIQQDYPLEERGYWLKLKYQF
ncbi:TonB-dependent receptor plug domain-containing protein [Marinifaba aquimaris]|uniref:TonB-dependent receptor plug domain-containing protein n=1 Tax=Marinifaba aquimaris TaxID=2741323 RepID=UPI001572D3CC|nr:TonB-dependent receptor [Marinifaba aquimaris]